MAPATRTRRGRAAVAVIGATLAVRCATVARQLAACASPAAFRALAVAAANDADVGDEWTRGG